MAANDSSIYVRETLVAALKAAGLVGGRVYGPQPPALPTWPFIRVVVDDVEPLAAQCLRGNTMAITVHVFVKGEGERPVSEVNGAVANLLSSVPRALPGAPYPAALKRLRWLRTQVIRDTDEATGWHGMVSFQGSVSS